MTHGKVLSLHRFPVKSMAGETAEALEVNGQGVEGDRRFAVWFRGGRRLTARVAPLMLAWHATLDNGLPRVTGPDGREYMWDDELERAVGEHIGKDVALVRDPEGLQDVQGTLLVTVEASRRLLEEELGIPIDIRRFRANVHVDLDIAPFEELGWEGRRIRIGDAELAWDHPCDRCAMTINDPDTLEQNPDVLRVVNARHDTFFGFRAMVTRPARIALGDPVEVIG